MLVLTDTWRYKIPVRVDRPFKPGECTITVEITPDRLARMRDQATALAAVREAVVAVENVTGVAPEEALAAMWRDPWAEQAVIAAVYASLVTARGNSSAPPAGG